MLRRVVHPMLLAVGTWAATTLAGSLSGLADRRALDAVAHGGSVWALPVLPDFGWLVFAAVFAAVQLCAARGGSPRECTAVGLAPLALAASGCAAPMVSSDSLPALGAIVGFLGGVADGRVTIGEVVALREGMAQLLGLAGTCLAATWLHFWCSARTGGLRAAGVS